jgi:hypothetical protein
MFLDGMEMYGMISEEGLGRVHLMSESRKKKHLPLELGQMLT